MRGKDMQRAANVADAGITPAHAGKSLIVKYLQRTRRAHPRPCGEKMERTDKMLLIRGSPPHMRGKEAFKSHHYGRQGITPAHAGKSRSRRTCRPPGTDHPRPCGEKFSIASVIAKVMGSPPPMRGKVQPEFFKDAAARITPAHAGKSLSKSS